MASGYRCKVFGIKESVKVRHDLNNHGTGLGHQDRQHGHRVTVLGYQQEGRDVMRKGSLCDSDYFWY